MSLSTLLFLKKVSQLQILVKSQEKKKKRKKKKEPQEYNHIAVVIHSSSNMMREWHFTLQPKWVDPHYQDVDDRQRLGH